MALKLVKYAPITAILRCKSGLRIGGSKDDIGIGEMDNPVLRHPLTDYPYIPGSSIKGKLRSLCEYREGLIQTDGRSAGEPHGCNRQGCMVCTLFGPHRKPQHDHGPTRLIVRDAVLTTEWQEKLLAAQETRNVNFTEVKSENWINRKTGTAGDPRPMERIPAGTEFDLNFSVRIFEGDNEQHILNYLREALAWLQKDTLGGSGTRGYGWVELVNDKYGE